MMTFHIEVLKLKFQSFSIWIYGEFANILEEHNKCAFFKKYGFLILNQILKMIHKSN